MSHATGAAKEVKPYRLIIHDDIRDFDAPTYQYPKPLSPPVYTTEPDGKMDWFYWLFGCCAKRVLKKNYYFQKV